METNYFQILNKIECKTEKKKELTYISWSDAWLEAKTLYPDSTYTIYENAEGFPFWESKFGIDCKVGVTINGIEHIIRLPVMDGANNAMKAESYKYTTKYGEKEVNGADSFDINKTIMRAFAKALAMHGIGLYVFRGEDFPEETETKKVNKSGLVFQDYIDSINMEDDTSHVKTLFNQACDELTLSAEQLDMLKGVARKQTDKINKEVGGL